jgi:hypothetical protein
MIYLASPYSGTPTQMTIRFFSTEKFLVKHLLLSTPIFSPIVYCHALARAYEMPKDAEYWKWLNTEFMELCSECWVLKLPGWEESKGVAFEILWFRTRGLLVSYMDPDK